MIVCEDDTDWGAVGNPQMPLPDNAKHHHLVNTFRLPVRTKPATMAGDIAA